MIHDLRCQGLSISAIARRTGLDRKTVRKYLDQGLRSARYRPREPRPRLLDPYEATCASRSPSTGDCPAAACGATSRISATGCELPLFEPPAACPGHIAHYALSKARTVNETQRGTISDQRLRPTTKRSKTTAKPVLVFVGNRIAWQTSHSNPLLRFYTPPA